MELVLATCIMHDTQGRIQDFHFPFFLGGGGGTIMCAHAHHERVARILLRPGCMQGSLKGPGSCRVLDALSCYLSLISKHSDVKWDFKKEHNGGGCLLRPPLDLSCTDTCPTPITPCVLHKAVCPNGDKREQVGY